MNKVLIGILLGGILGAIDGATAWFTPEVRSQMLSIIVGSTFKGVVAGVLAGWFARKVHSVAAGIAFGLVVGAVLAYGVVLANHGKYVVAIMLPGSVVGAIVGWATQRYGRSGAAATQAATAAFLLLVTAGAARAAEPITAADAFRRLKTLDGSWSSDPLAPNTPPIAVRYHVTSGGSVVEETSFVGTPNEMVTMFTVEGGDLVATHYCSAGNQPVMKLNRAKSTDGHLVFEFVLLHNEAANPLHLHGGTIDIAPDGSLNEAWKMVDREGRAAAAPHTVHLTRVR